jgi:gamma-glutamyl:cysteine ligase YbdK (ATP-grasp superfamily)
VGQGDGHQLQHELEARVHNSDVSTINARMDGLAAFADERWRAHASLHAQLAKSLDEYKAAANEWRALVSDFKSDYVSLAEWRAEQRALIGRVDVLERTTVTEVAADASNLAMNTRIAVLEKVQLETSTEAATVRDLFTNGRNLILLLIAAIGVTITLIVFLRG